VANDRQLAYSIAAITAGSQPIPWPILRGWESAPEQRNRWIVIMIE
jgi:hypothetical protein